MEQFPQHGRYLPENSTVAFVRKGGGGVPQICGKRRLTVRVHLVDHVLELRFCRVLTQRPHHGTQFLSGDGAIAILIKQTERLSEL